MPPRSATGELHALAEGRVDEAGAAADWARTAAEQIERLADRAQQLGPKGVADEVATFARRRPLAFLAGAAAAGFVVGRLARNAGQSTESGTASSTSSTTSLPEPGPAPALPAETALPIASPAPVGDPLVVGAGRIDV